MDGEISQSEEALAYAHELRQRHIVSTIYALPNNIRADIHERFSQGESSRQIATAINTKYHEEIRGELLRPITHTAINNYRNNYWRKTPAYRKLLITEDKQLAQEIEGVRHDANAYLQLLEYAKLQNERVMAFRKLENGLPITLSLVRKEIMLGIKILNQIVCLEIELGIREKTRLYQNR